MRIVFTTLLITFTTTYMKAQHSVIEPSDFKTTTKAQEVDGWEEELILDHKVVKLGSATQSKPAVSADYSKMTSDNYYDLSARSKKAPNTPTVISSFEANSYNGFTPADNSVAVSNDGIILSAINSNVYVYQTNGQLLNFQTFESLKRRFFPLLDGDWFDPRVVYDPDSDRFILVILHGHTPSSSRVLVFFSKTNNPVDGWNAYEIDGDVTEQNYWLDYPNIAVNKNSLFISGNMFNASNNFSISAILNISKADGYSGSSSLNYIVWDGFVTSTGNAFTIVPVQKGTGGALPETAYFVATDGGFGDFVMLYTLNTSTNSLNSSSFDIDAYDIPLDSPQKDSNDDVDMSDTRAKNAVLIDGSIHMVFTTSTSGGNAALAYYRYDVRSKKVSNAIFHRQNQNRFLSYPTVCAAGTEYNDQTVFIAFAECGRSIYPQMRVLSVDANMDASETLLKEGLGPVDILDENIERWGDYFTIVNRFSDNTAWAFGCLGNGNETFDNYLFQVSLDTEASQEEVTDAQQSQVALFPNPASEYINVNFSLEQRQVVSIGLYDQQGKLVQVLTEDAYSPGRHQLQLNIAPLSTGTYFVKIAGTDGLLANQQVVKR